MATKGQWVLASCQGLCELGLGVIFPAVLATVSALVLSGRVISLGDISTSKAYLMLLGEVEVGVGKLGKQPSGGTHCIHR